MEIVSLPQSGLRIKGKQASFLVDTLDKSTYNALILLAKSPEDVVAAEDVVTITGPGEYEVGGVKISGTKGSAGTVFRLKIDGLDILLGNIVAIEKLQQKLQEYNIVIVLCDTEQDGAFLTALSSNVILFYGDNAKKVSEGLSKENVNVLSKYQTTLDKLPSEVETVVLE